jgi:hypothetical protein
VVFKIVHALKISVLLSRSPKGRGGSHENCCPMAAELRTLSAIAAAEAIIAELDAFRLLMRLRKPHPQQP